MARLKDAVQAASYAELGRMLGLSTSAYANRKRSGAIPYEAIVELASSRGVSVDWLIFGEHIAPPEPTDSALPTSVDAELLGRVTIELFRASNQRASQQVLVEYGRLASLAGLIYNHVVLEPDQRKREDVLRREVAEMSNALRLLHAADTRAANASNE